MDLFLNPIQVLVDKMVFSRGFLKGVLAKVWALRAVLYTFAAVDKQLTFSLPFKFSTSYAM